MNRTIENNSVGSPFGFSLRHCIGGGGDPDNSGDNEPPTHDDHSADSDADTGAS